MNPAGRFREVDGGPNCCLIHPVCYNYPNRDSPHPAKEITMPSERYLCITSYEKGQDYMRQLAELGIKPTLLTVEKLAGAPWPREILEDVITMPPGLTNEQITNTVTWISRGRKFDGLVALDEFDMELVAHLREHMRIPGMGTSAIAYYRDKLAMRM